MTDHPEVSRGHPYCPIRFMRWGQNGCAVNRAPPPLPPPRFFTRPGCYHRHPMLPYQPVQLSHAGVNGCP